MEKNNKKTSSKSSKIFSILTFLGLYFFSTGVSFAVFDYLKKPYSTEKVSELSGSELEEKGLLINTSGPKTQTCPLNGLKYTEAEKEVWSLRRPLAVMIENHEESRPQSGISSADIVYEAVAEGGITRFMAVFYCGAVAKENIIGPIRSARTYFLDWASEYGPALYVHVGGAHCDPVTGHGCLNGAKADALGQIGDYGCEGENDLNQFSIGYPTFWRDYERLGHTVATEHTMYSTTERLWAVAKERGWTNENSEGEAWDEDFISWSFAEEENPGAGEVSSLEFNFWEGYDDYIVKWQYDNTSNSYKRFNGGQPHNDLNTGKQLEFKNIVVQFMKESAANDGYPGNAHLLYGTTGEGEALIFQNSEVLEGKWVKDSRKDRTVYYVDGKEIKFVPGKIWIETVPIGTEIVY